MRSFGKFKLGRGYTYTWVDVRGRNHLVTEMGDQHINNIIRCLEGKGLSLITDDMKENKRWMEVFNDEKKKKGRS